MKPINRVVSTAFWEDETVVNDFSPEDKYFYLYLLTNPHTTQLGVYKLVPKIAAFELGYSREAVLVLLDRFENKYGMIRYNSETCEVAIRNYLRHSIVKGGKPVLDCLLKEEKQVSDRSLLEYIYLNIVNRENLNTTVEEYINSLGNRLSINKNNITTTNDNNNDNDNDNERIVHESSTNRQEVTEVATEARSPYQKIIDAWKALSDIGIKPIRNVTPGSKRNDQLRARIREYGEDAVLEAIENIRKSDFLQGKNNRGWMITFDWFILPSNFPKVLEGNYDNPVRGQGGYNNGNKELRGADAFMAIAIGDL